MRLSKSKQLFHNQSVLDFGAVTQNERRFQSRLFNHSFRIVPGSIVHEQSEFT